MEVWIFAGLMGMWFSVLFLGVGILIGRGIHDKGNDNVVDKSMAERQPVLDSSSLSDVRCGCGDRSGNQSVLERMDADAAKETLETMRMAAKYSDTERDAIDYAKECIDIAHKLAEYWKLTGHIEPTDEDRKQYELKKMREELLNWDKTHPNGTFGEKARLWSKYNKIKGETNE